MKITAVRTTPFSLHLKQAMKFARGSVATVDHVLVEIDTDAGITGVAEAVARPYVYGESQRGIVIAIAEWFAPALIGSDPFAIARIWQEFDRVEYNHAAKAALDIALHDIMGQALGISCRKLLGGFGEDAAVTYICGIGSPAEVAEKALAMRAACGINSFKLKAGTDPLRDVAMMRTVRAALPDAHLTIDGNQGLTAHDALRVLKEAEAQNIAWAEEPCAARDRAGREIVARATSVPILGDESCRTPEEVATELDDRLVHLVSIKTARTGFTLSNRIASYCATSRVRTLVGSQADCGVGVTAAWHFATAHRSTQTLPAELAFFADLADDIVEEVPVIRNGRLALPEGPGLGIRIDRDRLEHCRVQ